MSLRLIATLVGIALALGGAFYVGWDYRGASDARAQQAQDQHARTNDRQEASGHEATETKLRKDYRRLERQLAQLRARAPVQCKPDADRLRVARAALGGAGEPAGAVPAGADPGG